MKINTKMREYMSSAKVEGGQELMISLTQIEGIISPLFFEWDGCTPLRQQNDKAPIFMGNYSLQKQKTLETTFFIKDASFV